jgi:hypothetical protein
MADEGFDVKSADLAHLAKQLKEAGGGDLRKQVLASIRKSASKAHQGHPSRGRVDAAGQVAASPG